MLIRISLIIAIIAGLAVGTLNFLKVKEKVVALKEDLRVQTEGRQKAETDLASTQASLERTNAVLKQTQATLAATSEERDKAVAEAAAQVKRAEQLNNDLNTTRQERDNAQAELAAYKVSGLSAKEVADARAAIKTLQDNLAGQQEENKVIAHKLERVQTELERFVHPEKPILLPAALRGKVLVADPKYNFVVLDVGEDQGVKPYGELLVNRDGRLVCKVKVTTVQKDRCIANVMPGWQLGDVLEGDQVIPAHPAS